MHSNFAILQEHHQSGMQFGPRSGATFCGSGSGSKLFAKVIYQQMKKDKEFNQKNLDLELFDEAI